jgi:hypothetical protein
VTPVKLLLIVGEPGSRIDYVGGWLGTLPNSITNHWTINVNTGHSQGGHGKFKVLDQSGYSCQEILHHSGMVLSDESETWCIGSCHNINDRSVVELVQQGLVKIAVINTDTVSRDTIAWEFLIKGHLSFGTNQRPDLNTDQERITAAELMLDFRCRPTSRIDYSHLPAVSLDYQLLFAPSGSRYLCNQLELSATDRHHAFWNGMLPFTTVPDSVERWGKIWRRSDYSLIQYVHM